MVLFPQLGGELREGITGDQPVGHRPADERREAGAGDQQQIEQRPADPRQWCARRNVVVRHQSPAAAVANGVIPGR